MIRRLLLCCIFTSGERAVLRALAGLRGCRVERLMPGTLLDALQAGRPAALLLAIDDARDPGWKRALRLARDHHPQLPVFLFAARGSEDLAIAALRAGVSDYFHAPFEPSEIHEALGAPPPPEPRLRSVNANEPAPLIGAGPQMIEIWRIVERIAVADTSTLVTGETGTGKELVAEWIHRLSARRERPLVRVNCAAIPDSLFESEVFGHERGAFTGAQARHDGLLARAHQGTAFLDEVGDLSAAAQAKLLRAIERKEIQRLGSSRVEPLDVRVVAATNRDLEQLVEADRFRRDLYYRLNVARIHLPPLKRRKEDLPALIASCVEDLNRRFGRNVEGFTDEATERLLRHDWPGNVRELKNLIEAVFVNLPHRCDPRIGLPEPFLRRLDAAGGPPAGELERLLTALLSTNWNKSRAAEQLRWSRMTLYRKLAKYHVEPPPSRPRQGTS